MSELAEVTGFLGARLPWSLLGAGRVSTFAARAEASYARRGEVVLAAGAVPEAMFVIRSGAMEVREADGQLVTHEEVGACFGQSSILESRGSRFTFVAAEDTLLWSFDADVVRELALIPQVGRFFTDSRLRLAGERKVPEGGPVLQVPVADLIGRDPITIGSTASVRHAAQLMNEHQVSAVLVTREDRLVGILTDRDLRKVVAHGIPGGAPIRTIMSLSPLTVPPDALALDVLLSLVENGIHHLPVVDGDRLVGMVTSGDLMRLEQASPLFVVGDLARQSDVPGLAQVMRKVPSLVARLLRQDATAADITKIISSTTEALWHRLAELAEDRLGPAPVPYCWVALGSLARHEQALGSDQDHAFILSDEARPEHDEYFAQLASFLTDALEACGFPRCKGGVMATNWRQPLAAWTTTFSGWLASPTAKAVLNSSIFFDLRPIHGDFDLAETLLRRVRGSAGNASRFLGHLAAHANDVEVPLGFWRGLVVEKRGGHRDRLDLKHGGITPIVDVARIYALRWALPHTGTRARLAAAAPHGARVENLLDAHEHLSYLRLRHQGHLLAQGAPPDNHLAPADLSEFERRSLRDALWFVSQAQKALTVTFQTQFIS